MNAWGTLELLEMDLGGGVFCRVFDSVCELVLAGLFSA